MGENAPGDAGQFIGERDRQHIAVQPLLGMTVFTTAILVRTLDHALAVQAQFDG